MNEHEKNDWMVYVSCMTFNQAPFIVDAMNGFTMQETNFPFVCVVVDDASTDSEQNVIKKYVNEHFDLEDKKVARHEETDDYVLTFARHKSNLNCYFAVLFLKYNHFRKKSKAPYLVQWREKAKYIASCEGDDYWIDSRRLQRQVDFLECHPNVSYVCTRYKILNQSTGEMYLRPNNFFDNQKNKGLAYYVFSRDDAFRGEWITKTLTAMFRRGVWNGCFVNKFKFFRDVHMIYMLLSKGDGVCFNFVSGVYRLNEGSTFGGKPLLERKRQNYLAYEELYNYTGDNVIKKKAAISYIPLFKAHYKSYRLPHNSLQLYALLWYWPISQIKKLF